MMHSIKKEVLTKPFIKLASKHRKSGAWDGLLSKEAGYMFNRKLFSIDLFDHSKDKLNKWYMFIKKLFGKSKDKLNK